MVNTTKPTSINKIYNELKSFGITVGKNALYDWIDHLESVYLFFALTKYDPSLVKENAAEKKYYCIDNGLLEASESLKCNNLWLITQEREEDLIRNGKTIKIRPAWWVCRQPAKEME